MPDLSSVNLPHWLARTSAAFDRSRVHWPAWAEEARLYNRWFTKESVSHMLDSITAMIEPDNLAQWLTIHHTAINSKKVGIVMAGNIPLAGFHDLLSVLVCGHMAFCKVSSQDPILIKKVAGLLIELEPSLAGRISFPDRLNGMNAVIATGSDNSARYFDYYFSAIPHLIRKNRTSVGVIDGDETPAELVNLGNDIVMYYGLGCRNISKLFVPLNYSFDKFYQSVASLEAVKNNNKFFNNYEYNRSIYLVNRVEHLDNGFLILTHSDQLVSPISVVYYEHYRNVDELKQKLEACKEKIQVIASRQGWFPSSIAFGSAQRPELWDYADGVNTMEFLTHI